MPKKMIRQLLLAQILATMTVTLCLLIDNVMINRFLGEQAIAAYELANPVLLISGAVAGLMATGVQVVCSRSLGEGSREETNRGYSSALALGLGIALVFMVLVLLFRDPIAGLMGAGSSQTLYDDTRNYMAGFVIGAPATVAALVLAPFLQMAGNSMLLVVAVLAMMITDIAADFLNVLVFHGGMFGMGLASSISYYVAVLIAMFYFLSKKCEFRFSFSLVTRKKMKELVLGGLPMAVGSLASVVLIFVLNQVLMRTGGAPAVAAYAIVNGIGGAANSISTGASGVMLTLTGVLYSEEDRNGLRELIRTMLRYAAVLGVATCLLVIFLAPTLIGIFLPDGGETCEMAVVGMRLFVLGLIPCCMFNVLKGYYQGSGRILFYEVISVLECGAIPALASVLLGLSFGTEGVWLYFVVAEALILIGTVGYAAFYARGCRDWKDAILMLREDFGVEPGQLMEAEIHSLEEAAGISAEAEHFCLEQGGDPVFANRVAVCVEEMASNTVQHGFREGRENLLSVRIQHRNGRWVLRFRDDCRAFDPVSYVPPEGAEEALGLRLVLGMADDIRYTYLLSMNNLTIFLNEKRALG